MTKKILAIVFILMMIPGLPFFNLILPTSLSWNAYQEITGILPDIDLTSEGDWEIPNEGWKAYIPGVRVNSQAYNQGLRSGDTLILRSNSEVFQDMPTDRRARRLLYHKVAGDQLLPLTPRDYTIRRDGREFQLQLVFKLDLWTIRLIYIHPRFIVGLLLGFIGLFVFFIRPLETVSLLFCLTSILAYWAFVVGEVLPFLFPFSWLMIKNTMGNVGQFWSAVTFFHLFSIFPRQSLWIRKYPKSVYVIYAYALLVGLGYVYAHWNFVHNSFFYQLTIGSAVTFLLSGITVAVYNYRRIHHSQERIKIKWLMFGVVFGILPLIAFEMLPKIFTQGSMVQSEFWVWASEMSMVTMMLLPVSMGIAIVRHRLMDVDFVFRRSMLIAVLSIVVIIVYALIVGILSLVFGVDTRVLENPFLIIVFIFLSIVFWPLKEWLQSWIDRTLFKKDYDYKESILTFARESNNTISLLELIDIFSNRVVELMNIPRMALYLLDQDGAFYRLVDAKIPDEKERGSKVPIKLNAREESIVRAVEREVHELSADEELHKAGFIFSVRFKNKNRVIGLAFLGEKKSELEYDRDDLDLLKTFSNQFAIAMDNALAYKQIKEMNVTLEQKIHERTGELQSALTNLKTTQAQLIHVEKLAGLSEMVAGIVHEVNNPLTFVKANMSLLLSDLKKVQGADSLIENMKSSIQSSLIGAERIEKIITELKNFSKLNESDEKAFDLHEGLHAMEHMYLNQFRRDITWHTEYHAKGTLYGNPREINVAILELLKNAVDAIARKTGARNIWISTGDKDSTLILTIRDDGDGVDDAIRDKIFNPFFTTKDVGDGTGMGLSEAFGVAQRHGGTIEFESEMGKGSTFRMILPIKPEERE